jgi:hypothetical protein
MMRALASRMGRRSENMGVYSVIPGREHGERTRNPDAGSERAGGFRVRRDAPSRNDAEKSSHIGQMP